MLNLIRQIKIPVIGDALRAVLLRPGEFISSFLRYIVNKIETTDPEKGLAYVVASILDDVFGPELLNLAAPGEQASVEWFSNGTK